MFSWNKNHLDQEYIIYLSTSRNILRVWFQNAVNAKSKISELTTPWCYTNKVLLVSQIVTWLRKPSWLYEPNAFPSKFQTLTAFFSNTQKWIYSVLEPNSSFGVIRSLMIKIYSEIEINGYS
jgi:hypothetical protein